MRFIGMLCFFTVVSTHGVASPSSNNEPSEFFNLTFENDLFFGEDDGYTNGFGLTFATGPFDEFDHSTTPSWLLPLIKRMPIADYTNRQRGFAHRFYQRMQTPDDIEEQQLIPDDLPYAGLLAWQGIFYAWNDKVVDRWSLTLGVVGPASYADKTQNIVHDLLSSDNPRGWDNQIGPETVFKLEANRNWKIFQNAEQSFDIIGLTGASIGTLNSSAKTAIGFRWGEGLDTSFPTFSLYADRQVNPLSFTPRNDFYFFTGLQISFVANDIFIDGNTFSDSHSVPLRHWQGLFSIGSVWSWDRYGFVFQFASASSRTTIIDQREKFGAVSLTYHF